MQHWIAHVEESWKPTPTTHAVRLTKPEGLDFLPTQSTLMLLGDEKRPMSLATSPTRGHLEYATRISSTTFKQAFQELRPGDEVRLLGPKGDFILDEYRPAVLVAGGIGITPFKAMAEFAVDTSWQHAMALVYSSRTRDEIVYKDELAALERNQAQFRVHHTLTRAPADWQGWRGHVSQHHLDEASEDMDNPVYYVAGTAGFVEHVRSLLPGKDVRWESFWGYEPTRLGRHVNNAG